MRRIVPAVQAMSRENVSKLRNGVAGMTPAFWRRTEKPNPWAKARGTVR
jgi:hypothetical protein